MRLTLYCWTATGKSCLELESHKGTIDIHIPGQPKLTCKLTDLLDWATGILKLWSN